MSEKKPKLTESHWEAPLVIAGIYFLIGVIWIFLSDKIVIYRFQNFEQIQTIKGLLFVLVTSWVIYLLIRHHMIRQKKPIIEMTSHNLLLNNILKQQSQVSIMLINRQGLIKQAYGSSPIWENRQTGELKGLNFMNWPPAQKSKNQFSSFIKNIWTNKQDSITITLRNDVFKVKGMLLTDLNTSIQIAVITIQNIKELYQTKNLLDESLLKIQTLEKQMANSAGLLSDCAAHFDHLSSGIIIQDTTLKGLAGQITYMNNSAKQILKTKNDANLTSATRNEVQESIARLLHHDFNRKSRFEDSFIFEEESQYHQIKISSFYNKNTAAILTRLEYVRPKKEEAGRPIYDSLGIMNNLTDGVMLITPDQKCLYINNSMKDLLHLSADNNCEVSLNEIRAITGDIDNSSYIQKALEGDKVVSSDYMLGERKNNWYCSDYYPIFNTDGNVQYILRLTHLAHQNTLRANRTTEQSSEPLYRNFETDVIPGFSHEILTSLNGILGATELLENLPNTEEQYEYINLIRKSSEDVNHLVESLKLLTQLNNNQLTPQNGWFKVSDLADQLLDYTSNLQSRHSKNDLKINSHVAPALKNGKIFCDHHLLTQILQRLIDNAIKYTHKGAVEIGFNFTRNQQKLIIWIKDTGVGISTSNLPSIYLPFSSIVDRSRGIFGGVGIGLTIAKGLTETLGGSIEVDSIINEGTTFTIQIPLNKKRNTPENLKTSPQRMKVLIAQYGYKINQEIVFYLKENNIEVLNANTGGDAITLLAEQKDIGIIFSDIRHSDMDGSEFIHAAKRIRPNITLIAQAPYLIPEEKIKYLNEGFDDYLIKPVSNALFIKTIEKFVANVGVAKDKN
ncbi:ATP-binding protein [Geofilum sp. OHC36d9]|uniref:ATP-binding protein n=1 Tax=Geofilum sp. OHC36d9 TaxID=3458413 RepID=UPI004033F9AE